MYDFKSKELNKTQCKFIKTITNKNKWCIFILVNDKN